MNIDIISIDKEIKKSIINDMKNINKHNFSPNKKQE